MRGHLLSLMQAHHNQGAEQTCIWLALLQLYSGQSIMISICTQHWRAYSRHAIQEENLNGGHVCRGPASVDGGMVGHGIVLIDQMTDDD